MWVSPTHLSKQTEIKGSKSVLNIQGSLVCYHSREGVGREKFKRKKSKMSNGGTEELGGLVQVPKRTSLVWHALPASAKMEAPPHFFRDIKGVGNPWESQGTVHVRGTMTQFPEEKKKTTCQVSLVRSSGTRRHQVPGWREAAWSCLDSFTVNLPTGHHQISHQGCRHPQIKILGEHTQPPDGAGRAGDD